ncbi:MAG: hypothetical protein BMS9Abin07_0682 [Acidimicrobiia bacterium]|nr:MAG: hypothetical protein BMS9Abin07_0682 [Acidimicrobiia bacterium]
MKRLTIMALLAAGVILAMRRMLQMGGPEMREKTSEACERMLSRMPESFPPNRMMADLDFLKEQSARLLDVLEGRTKD